MCTPARIAPGLVELDRRGLRVADVEVEDLDPKLPRRLLDGGDETAGEAVAARPRRNEGAHELCTEGLRLVVARLADELRRTADDAVEPPDEEQSPGHHQHTLPVLLQHLAERLLDPAVAAAFFDRGLGRLAEILEVGARE